MHCVRVAKPGKVECMKRRSTALVVWAGKLTVTMLLAYGICSAEQPSPAAIAGFNKYVVGVEARLAAQHRQAAAFIALARPASGTEARLRRGELLIENLTPAGNDLPGAMLYDWRGTAFLPGATAAEFEALMRNLASYPRVYTPEIISAKVLSQTGDRYQAAIRVKQKHVITVVMDTTYDVEFGQLDAHHGWSTSRSTNIDEIENAGTKSEHVLSHADQHGFLWRLNTYWTFEERDGGLYMQIESVSLMRSIPTGLGWVIGPFVESVPRQSLEFTLRATRYALRR
jgi:hypothetical protein